ncbi:MAG: RsmE family RNA methyltransferase [Phycisphaerae bacterium]
MDAYRFYVPDLVEQSSGGAGGVIRLPEDQSHHARGVLRLEAGEKVVIFDGKGGLAEGVLAESGGKKSPFLVKIEGGVRFLAGPRVQLTLATAVPKGERAEWLVEQASQLNVSCLQWVDCERSVVKPKEGGGKMEKWRRLAVESAKQCHRVHVMGVEEPVGVGEVLGRARGEGALVLWLEPREDGSSRGVGTVVGGMRNGKVVALVGPEGGWSTKEWGVLEGAVGRGEVVRVRLTETILRIETAGVAIAAIVMSGG